MKIAIIATSCYRKTGGVTHAVWQTALELVKHGHQVHIIPIFDSRDKYVLPDSDIHVHRIHVRKLSIYEFIGKDVETTVFKRISLIPKIMAYIFRVVKVILSIRPDIVHASSTADAIPALFVKILSRTPYTLTIHGQPGKRDVTLMGVRIPSRVSNKFRHLNPQMRFSNKIISLTSSARLAISDIYGYESAVIPNGVNSDVFYPKFSARSNPHNSLNIISVGLLGEAKDYDSLIKSMAYIIQDIPCAHLTIIGNGPLYDEHEMLVETLGLSDCVTLLGYLPHHLIVEYLQKSHIYILSSVTEGFPLVLLEAMACGLPIISTPVSSAPEIINKWSNGYIVPFKSPKDIASAVVNIIKNNEISILSTQSLLGSQEYTWTSVSEKYLEMFVDVLSHK